MRTCLKHEMVIVLGASPLLLLVLLMLLLLLLLGLWIPDLLSGCRSRKGVFVSFLFIILFSPLFCCLRLPLASPDHVYYLVCAHSCDRRDNDSFLCSSSAAASRGMVPGLAVIFEAGK